MCFDAESLISVLIFAASQLWFQNGYFFCFLLFFCLHFHSSTGGQKASFPILFFLFSSAIVPILSCTGNKGPLFHIWSRTSSWFRQCNAPVRRLTSELLKWHRECNKNHTDAGHCAGSTGKSLKSKNSKERRGELQQPSQPPIRSLVGDSFEQRSATCRMSDFPTVDWFSELASHNNGLLRICVACMRVVAEIWHAD